MKIKILYILSLIMLSYNLHTENHNHPAPQSIEEVLHFHEADASKIKKRYSINTNKHEFFSQQEKDTINNQNTYDIIDRIFLHKYIELNQKELLLSFADEIQKSGFRFERLEIHCIKHILNGETPFAALRKAIQKLEDTEWYTKQLSNLPNNDSFMKQVNKLELSVDDYEKLRHVYAVCINSWQDNESRHNRLQPKICDPEDGFKKPRHHRHPAAVRISPSNHPGEQTKAYRYLTTKAVSIADELNLNTAERVVMAKCIAEKSLKFFEPMKSPLKSLVKIRDARMHAPEHEFFSDKGVCINFAGIAYNLSRALGLENQLYLANRNFHTYLEVEIDGMWYHSHPFNSNNKKCDLTRFGKI